MGNITANLRKHKHKHRKGVRRHTIRIHHRKRGGVRTPPMEEPHKIIKRKMKSEVTRRRAIDKANSESLLGKTRRRTPAKKQKIEAIVEEEEEF